MTETPPRAMWGILLGAAALGLMQIAAEFFTTKPYIGEFLYNYYFLSLTEGRATVPAQIAGLEGFYDANGRAYLYHGLGPMITRLLAWPFVDLTLVDLRSLTIWLFAVVGTAGFYATALAMLARVWPETGGRGLLVLVWVMVWLLSPGWLLASNGAFYHEPLAFAYAMAGLGLYALWRLVGLGFRSWPWLLALALVASLAVHGRPHVAVGLYAATVISTLIMLARLRLRSLLPGAAAMLILLAAGLVYLQMNAIRFGSATEITGTVSNPTARAEYGFRYWGWEPPDHPRFTSQATHGSFLPGRILPNLYLYGVSMGGPDSMGRYRAMTVDMGHIRVEPPVIGFGLIWLPWVLLAAGALVWRSGPRSYLALGLLTVVPATLVMLSYTTVTLRYRVEIWPALFVPAMFALTGLVERYGARPEMLVRTLRLVGVASVGALIVTGAVTVFYLDILNWEWGWAMRSYEDCARMVTEHPDLGAERVAEICVLDVPAS